MAAPPPPTGMHDDVLPQPKLSPNQSVRQAQVLDNKFCLSTPFDLCVPCNNCFVVPERTHYVQLYFGNYHGTITQPGCYCRSSCAVEIRRVGTDLNTYNLPKTKVIDASGTPVIISGIITYEIVDARKAAIDVNDPHNFIRDQAAPVLKRVVSQFPYESPDPNIPSLRTETVTVADRMQDALQQRVNVAGVRVDNFSIDELSYAPEIAQAMLKRQQAEALIGARRSIVTGARDIAEETLSRIGGEMTSTQKASLLSNLLVVLVSDGDVTPTVQVGHQ